MGELLKIGKIRKKDTVLKKLVKFWCPIFGNRFRISKIPFFGLSI